MSGPVSRRPAPAIVQGAGGVPVTEAEIHRAVASIDDPEYPGVSIVDLGLLESISIDHDAGTGMDRGIDGAGARVTVGLVPTFSGCPALAVIAEDVSAAVAALPGVVSVEVEWLAGPAWTVDRVSHDARAIMAESFTVAVQIGSASGPSQARCPRCGSMTEEQSMFGPSRCRSVHRCTECAETVEVLRA